MDREFPKIVILNAAGASTLEPSVMLSSCIHRQLNGPRRIRKPLDPELPLLGGISVHELTKTSPL